MDETPTFDGPKPKTHHRERSITTIADNVNNDDDMPSKTKNSRPSSGTSVNSISVQPKSPDVVPAPNGNILDNNANNVDNKAHPKEKRHSKVRHYKPNTPIDQKPTPLKGSYKHFSGKPPKYREYKYKGYNSKNTDIPSYQQHKYREYNKYRDYKLTHYNTFGLGDYRENVPKKVNKKPIPVRPKKPPKKNGILSAHSMLYPYSEFRYRPYENVKDYKYRDYSGYKEYKGRQEPLSTWYNFIGIWRPFGSKVPITWKKYKNFDPPCSTMMPPENDTKLYDPPMKKMHMPTESDERNEKYFELPQRFMLPPTDDATEMTKLYDPPKGTLMEPLVPSAPPIISDPIVQSAPPITEEYKLYDRPQKIIVLMTGPEPDYVEETKRFEPPQMMKIPPPAEPVIVEAVNMVPLQSVPQEIYMEETKQYDPPERSMHAPTEYVEEVKEFQSPKGEILPPREYFGESKEFDPPHFQRFAPKEYEEEVKIFDPLRSELLPPREYVEETKTLNPEQKQLSPPLETIPIQEEASLPVENQPVVEEIEHPVQSSVPIIVPETVTAVLSSRPSTEELPQYEEETKFYDPEVKTLSSPKAEENLTPYEPETKEFDPVKKSISVPKVEEDISEYEEEFKLFDPVEKYIEQKDQLPDYEEEQKVFDPIKKSMAVLLEEPQYQEETRDVEPLSKFIFEPVPEEILPEAEEETKILESEPTEKANSPIVLMEEPNNYNAAPPPTDPSPEIPETQYEEEFREFSPLKSMLVVPQETEEEYQPETKSFSPVSAQMREPKKERVAVIPVPETEDGPTVERAPEAAAIPPMEPIKEEVKEAWEPSESPKTLTPKPVEKPQENIPRPASEPASESSIIDQGKAPSEEASPPSISPPPKQPSRSPTPVPKSPPVVLPRLEPIQPSPPQDNRPVKALPPPVVESLREPTPPPPSSPTMDVHPVPPRAEILEPRFQPLESPRLSSLKMSTEKHAPNYRKPERKRPHHSEGNSLGSIQRTMRLLGK